MRRSWSAPRPRSPDGWPSAEKAAKGAADDAAFRRAGEAAAEEAELITDGQGSAAYKKELVRVYVARALRAALGGEVMATRTIGSGQVGRSVPRLEGAAKVTGRADYVHNLRLPKMLIGKIFRSTVAHGRIKSLDVSAARGAAGRLSRGDHRRHQDRHPDPFYGPAFHDQPILADGKVHYVGEPVAVVLATDPHIAEEAASLIEAEYEELPAVFDEVEAMTSKAVVHDELKPAGTFPDLKHLKGKKDTNIALDFHLRRGDAQKAFAEAEHVFEHTFRSQQVLHVPLEPFVSVAELTETGLTIHTASQSPSFVRIEIARLLGWPENKVRVKVPYLGGGFGAKLYIKLEALVAALALLVQRPVKISLTMEEQFYTLTKHAATFRIKSAVKDGQRHRRANARSGGTAAPMPISARASRRSRASPRPAPTTSTTSRSIPIRSTPT